MKGYKFLKFIILAVLSLSCFYASFAFAIIGPGAATSGFGGMASQLVGNLPDIAKLITGASFLAGLGFAFAAIMKFKQHKDNPTQIPIGTPIAMLFIAVALLFLPALFRAAGSSMGLSTAGTIYGNISI
jgi:intracellular multiplication protein IcmD